MDAPARQPPGAADSVALARAVERELAEALTAYLRQRNEAGLVRAYGAGRAALQGGLSIPAVVAMHGRAVRAMLARGPVRTATSRQLSLAARFLAEALAPYEMTHRGYHEALRAQRQLNESMEREVRRIAHALHDDAGQLLVSVHLEVEALRQAVAPPLQPRVQHLARLLEQVEAQLRNLSHELRPTLLDDLGWLPALQFLADAVARRSGLAVSVASGAQGRLPTPLETALFRCVQEALTNATRHARASSVRIEVRTTRGALRCVVADDGVGFDPQVAAGAGGLGLRGMRERITAVGGALAIESAPGGGTRILLDVPVLP
jgi:signal transduction histidine kinase